VTLVLVANGLVGSISGILIDAAARPAPRSTILVGGDEALGCGTKYAPRDPREPADLVRGETQLPGFQVLHIDELALTLIERAAPGRPGWLRRKAFIGDGARDGAGKS